MSSVTQDVIWRPHGEYLNSRVVDFMNLHGMKDWRELVKKSTDEIEWFWSTFCQYAGIQWSNNYLELLDQTEGMAWARWFTEGKTNIAYNCLDWHLETGRHAGVRQSVGACHPALIWQNEDGDQRELTYGQLNEMAGKVAALLGKLGLKPGDPVAVYMPMVPEVVGVLFGCLKFGAPIMPVFSGYGAQALQVRLAACGAKVLFTADGGVRRGKLIEIKKDVDEAAEETETLKHVIVYKNRGNPVSFKEGRDLWFDQAVNALAPAPTNFDLPAEAPSMYLYTSGTTGKPKGCVHTHAGAMAQIIKEHGLSFNVDKDDIFFWLTDIGWMMGPWEMIGVTFWGGTMVIYEGAPNYPSPDRLWQLVDDLKVTTLGISPTAIRVLKAEGDQWVEKHHFSTLRYLGSTGEPWDLESYLWFFEKVGGKRCPIINISGGTEIVGCLLLPLPIMPLKPCSLGTAGLGMAVDVFDEGGNSLSNAIGHLVCKKPSPSMTKGFLNDRERYLDTYFSKFADVWYHGDWAKVDADGDWFLYGRSDDTIKVAGKRVGPGEVESVLIEHPAVAEAAVIGVPHEIKGEALVSFVVLMPNVKPEDHLVAEIKEHVSEHLGHTLKPEKIHFVKALPKTRSGKIVRGAIRKKYLGESNLDTSAVENPEALALIEPQSNLPKANAV
jgi:acetyl-CoA synthetase